MKRTIIGLMAAALLMLPAISAAQKQGGEQGKHKAKMSKMHTNMGEMANMMSKMSQMIDLPPINVPLLELECDPF